MVAHMGMYHDQYHFAGRLQAPLHEEDDVASFKNWLIEHPGAYAIVYTKNIKRLQGVEMIASQRYLSGAVALLDAQTALSVLSTPGALSGNLD